jgi:adenylate cyclase
MLRVVALAVKRGRPCAWVIAVGFLATGVSAAYSLTQFVLPGLFVPIPGQMLGILCLLISMSIYLARDVGQTNRDLETRSDELRTLNSELEARVEQRTEFIRSIFGRYLTDEVVESVLSDPEGLDVGGGKRTVTILMSDLRGFSTMAETMDPEQVVLLLNNYLGSMTDVIHRWEGTIDEFIGDAIMVLFGAPVWTDDHASRAVQCALEMQRAISGVNARNLSLGLPTVEMGIGVHTGDVVVGNIGSEKRAKYGVVGNAVNLAARIESFTDGGQVLVSEDTWRLVANVAEPAGTRTVQPKGLMSPITLYELKGEAAS